MARLWFRYDTRRACPNLPRSAAVSIERRTEVLADLADGVLALRDFLELSDEDINELERLGATAIEGGKLELAIKVFTALEALDPFDGSHTLHRAEAEAAAGRTDDAIASATRYLERDAAHPAEQVARMLMLRASLLRSKNVALATVDQRAAEILLMPRDVKAEQRRA